MGYGDNWDNWDLSEVFVFVRAGLEFSNSGPKMFSAVDQKLFAQCCKKFFVQ